MNRWNPCRRRDFIRKVRSLGFDGPLSGARHQFVVYSGHRLAIPSNNEYSVPQLRILLRQVAGILERGISAEEWNAL